MDRTKGIGGSDAGVIIGLSPFKNPLELYLEKRGLVDQDPMTEYMKWGVILEPVVIKEYASRTGNIVKEAPALIHPKHGWMLGHPDGIASNGDGAFGLEVKCVSSYGRKHWGEEFSDEIPKAYIAQVQHYMAIDGLPYYDVAALIGGNEFKLFRVVRDEKLIKNLIDHEHAFWMRVQQEKPPPADATEASKRALAKMFPRDLIGEIEPTDSIVEAVHTLRSAKESLARLGEVQLLAENKIKEHMGEAGSMIGEGFKITWKRSKDGKMVPNYERMCKGFLNEAELKELLADPENMKPGRKGSRRFLPKFQEETDD